MAKKTAKIKAGFKRKKRSVDKAWADRIKFEQKTRPVTEELRSLLSELRAAILAARSSGKNPETDSNIAEIGDRIRQARERLERLKKTYGIGKNARV